jgi:hypothetical protein
MGTTYLDLATPTTGTEAGTWGALVNSQISGYIDDYLAKPLALSLTSSNVTLTQAEARCQMIRMTGSLLASVVVSGAAVLWNGFRCFQNLTTGNFTVTFTNAGGSVVIPQGRNGVVYMDPVNGPRIVSLVGSSTADPIPTGTKWAFYQASAPSGYTQDTSLNDYAIRIVNATGAGTGGSVNFSTLFGRTAVDSHALTASEIPNGPGLTYSKPAVSAIAVGTGTNVGYSTSTFVETGLTGAGGNGHTHNIDMRVKYADFIIAARA